MRKTKQSLARFIFDKRALVTLAGLVMACGPRAPGHGHPTPKPDAAPPDDAATSDTGAPPVDATVSAYAALTAGAIDRLPQVLSDLDSAFEKAPDYGRAAFFGGTFRLWKLAEGAQGYTVAQMAPYALPMIDRLRKAHDLLPGDPRVPAFLGLGEVRVGLILNSNDLIDSGRVDLDEGITRLPAYGHFLRVSAFDGTAKDSADFQSVIDNMKGVIQYCTYQADASGRYQYLQGPLDYARHVCNDDGIVPHVWEGLFITFGDIAVKAGWEPEKARALYESAKSSPAYGSWPFAPDLEKRIAEIELRASLYADGDKANDPPVWTDAGHVCTGCHQAHP